MSGSAAWVGRGRARRLVIAAALLLAAAAALIPAIVRFRSTPASMDHGGGADGANATAADTIAWTPQERRRIATLSPLGPPPPDPTNRLAEDDVAAAFGQRIFFDAGFSRGPAISCATCHDPGRWFTDGLAVPEGTLPGVRNT